VEKGLLEIGVQVNLNNTMRDASSKLLLAATRPTVEDQEEGLVFLAVDLLFGIGLMLSEELRMQFNVSGLVHTMDISESRGDRKVGRNRGKSFVNFVDIFGLSVKGVVVDTSVINTVLFTSSDTDFL